MGRWEQEREGEEDFDYHFEDLAPFGRDWLGLAPPGEPMKDPDVVADWYAGLLHDDTARLGLVAAARSADTLAVTGWTGPASHAQTAPLAAVVRSWEDRFGVRVARVGSTPWTSASPRLRRRPSTPCTSPPSTLGVGAW